MNNEVSYHVYLRVTESKRVWNYNTVITVVDPPTDLKELATVLQLKAMAQNPSANKVEVIYYSEINNE